MSSIVKVEFLESEYQSLIKQMLVNDLKKHTHVDIIFYAGEDERRRGYDIEVRTLIPLFLQLKVSNFYPQFGKSQLTLDRQINLGYNDNPGHYAFGLHLDKKTKSYMQHNLLTQLHSQGMYARYVAPLFHRRNTLTRYDYNPPSIYWAIHSAALHGQKAYHFWRDYILFPDSITIAPHQIVNDAKPHKYTYNDRGQIAFHSEPKGIEERGRTLHEFVMRSAQDASRREGVSLRSVIAAVANAILLAEFSDTQTSEGSKERIPNHLVRYKLSIDQLRKLGDNENGEDDSSRYFFALSNFLLQERGIICALGTISK